MLDSRIAQVIKRLTADAHNETGSIRAYARSLLTDLDQPLPPDPEVSKLADPFDKDDPFNDPFPAQYHGTCVVAGDEIFPSELIVRCDDGGYAHEECAE